MPRRTVLTLIAASLGLTLFAGLSFGADQADDSPDRNIPAAFAALEYLTGRWMGQGVPKNDPANAFRGWTETHSWSWVFKEGKPIALSLSVEGGHILASGRLTYDPARNLYRLDGVTSPPASGPIRLEGKIESARKRLVLESVGKVPHFAGIVRLSMGPNANFIRYTMREDRKEPGSTQFSPFIDAGLTKEGESFAGGTMRRANEPSASSPARLPPCPSLTKGPATRCVAPVAAMNSWSTPRSTSRKPASCNNPWLASRSPTDLRPRDVSRAEDAFAGDVTETEGEPVATDKPKPAAKKNDTPKAEPSAPKATAQNKPATKKQVEAPASKDAARPLRVCCESGKISKRTAGPPPHSLTTAGSSRIIRRPLPRKRPGNGSR